LLVRIIGTGIIGVATAMKSNKRANPIDINLLSPYAVVQIADALAQLVEHSCRFQRGKETVLLFMIRLILDETPAYRLKNKTARSFEVTPRRRVRRQASELGRKTVSL